MPVHHIKSADEFKKFVDEDKFTIVDFTATWCGPCQMIKPIFEKLSNDEKFKNVQFLKVDVDELQDVSSDAGIEAMPTFHIYKKGEKKDELVGASEEELIELLNKNVK